MKKKIIYSSALAALLSASSIALAGGPEEVIIPVEDYFSGFWVGGTGSVHQVDMDGSSEVNLTQDVPNGSRSFHGHHARHVDDPFFTAQNILTYSTDGQSVDGFGGVQGGFGWTFRHRWYLGIVGFGDFGTQSSTSTSVSTLINAHTANGLVTDVATITSSTETKIKSDYGVAGKLGWLVFPRTMVYGKIGAAWAKIEVSNFFDANNSFTAVTPGRTNFLNITADASANTSNSDTKTGFYGALGAEQIVWDDWVSVNIEYDYFNYGSVNTGPVPLTATATATTGNSGGPVVIAGPTTINAVTTQASGNATVNAFTVGINFYFGRHWLNGWL